MIPTTLQVPFEHHIRTRISRILNENILHKVLSDSIQAYLSRLEADFELQPNPELQERVDIIANALESDLSVTAMVAPSPHLNAFSFPHSSDPQKSYIVLTSPLLEKLNTAETDFVIAHEFGHILLRHHDLQTILHLIYRDFSSMPPFLNQLFGLWKQLSELSADRYGSFYTQNPDTLKRVCLLSGVSDRQRSLRTAALQEYLAQGNSAAEQKIFTLVEHFEATTDSQYYILAGRIISYAGLMLAHADQHMSDNEYQLLLNLLSDYQFSPLETPAAATDLTEKLHSAAAAFCSRYPEKREELFAELCLFILADKRITEREYEVLYSIGSQHLTLSRDSIHSLLEKLILSPFFQPFGVFSKQG